MMKRIIVLLIAITIALSIFAFPASAAGNNEDNKNFLETLFSGLDVTEIFTTIGNALSKLSNITDIFSGNIATIDGNLAKITLESGGFNYVTANSNLNKIISVFYKLLYPIGFAIMLLCWSFGVAKGSISTSLDIKDKNSIIHSVLSLIIGLAAMSLAPQVLTLLTGASQWLCNSIFDAAMKNEFLGSITSNATLSIFSIFTGGSSEKALFTAIVLLVVDLVFIINILWIALLQCLSPIFIGLMANKGTRKISFNFIKEYLKAMLVPVLTIIYFFLASSLMQETFHAGGLIVSVVLAISTLGIAGKKLDKLIN